MLNATINTGDLVEILQESKNVGMALYSSKVENIEETTVLVHAPTAKGSFVRLPKNEQYLLVFITGEGLYRFKSTINNYVTEDGFRYISFELLDEGESLTKRSYFRLNCFFSAKFKFLVKNKVDEVISTEMHDGIVIDLSGGGLKMITKFNMKEQDSVIIALCLEGKNLVLLGEVRTKYVNLNAEHPYQYGIMFIRLPDEEQDIIVKYLHKQQSIVLKRTRNPSAF